ncbi:uncharacterized protein CLUP02_09791 [Colletotrichum lupini]|uniref:Uncharacterized protein n=1 Tax=Colletotrichum lupini TaxID=145971 RepID=A0A9Q8SWB9_9PEZI|nr:uncharacterized protein CLUP02_09791 [Colletotrichum lupini]UQC84295.1 hypothetical protein CLUP02_09791 [Colletotrichum lupini]
MVDDDGIFKEVDERIHRNGILGAVRTLSLSTRRNPIRSDISTWGFSFPARVGTSNPGNQRVSCIAHSDLTQLNLNSRFDLKRPMSQSSPYNGAAELLCTFDSYLAKLYQAVSTRFKVPLRAIPDLPERWGGTSSLHLSLRHLLIWVDGPKMRERASIGMSLRRVRKAQSEKQVTPTKKRVEMQRERIYSRYDRRRKTYLAIRPDPIRETCNMSPCQDPTHPVVSSHLLLKIHQQRQNRTRGEGTVHHFTLDTTKAQKFERKRKRSWLVICATTRPSTKASPLPPRRIHSP